MMLNSERILTNQEFRELLNGSLGSLEKSPVARFAKAGDTCVRMDLDKEIVLCLDDFYACYLDTILASFGMYFIECRTAQAEL